MPDPPWRRWYKLARWVKLRERVLIRDLFTCADCGRIHPGKGTAAVDHIKAHRGNEALFWDEDNLQVLCISPCHAKHKQSQEAGTPPGIWY
jgi:5-methylcytosine-specific restriction endonuclease McrA